MSWISIFFDLDSLWEDTDSVKFIIDIFLDVELIDDITTVSPDIEMYRILGKYIKIVAIST